MNSVVLYERVTRNAFCCDHNTFLTNHRVWKCGENPHYFKEGICSMLTPFLEIIDLEVLCKVQKTKQEHFES